MYYLDKYRHCINEQELKAEVQRDIKIADVMDRSLIQYIKRAAEQVAQEKGYRTWK